MSNPQPVVAVAPAHTSSVEQRRAPAFEQIVPTSWQPPFQKVRLVYCNLNSFHKKPKRFHHNDSPFPKIRTREHSFQKKHPTAFASCISNLWLNLKLHFKRQESTSGCKEACSTDPVGIYGMCKYGRSTKHFRDILARTVLVDPGYA